MTSCYLNTSVLKFNESIKDPSFGSDALVLDLEDSVHDSQKSLARKKLPSLNTSNLRDGVELGIRINNTRSMEGIKDLCVLQKIIEQGLLDIDFIQIPKVECSYEIKWLRSTIGNLLNNIKIIPIIETPVGVENVHRIAVLSDAMMFGQVDMLAAMYKPNKVFLEYSRAKFCVACFNSNIVAIDTANFTSETDIKDEALFETQCLKSKLEGFMAKAVVHPIQIPIVKKIYTLDQNELNHKLQIIDAYNNEKEGFSIKNNSVVAPPFVSHAKSVLKIFKYN